MRRSEWPLAILAFLILPALILDNHSRGMQFHRLSEAINWIVWVGFCGEIGIKAWLSGDVRTFWKHSWFDLAIVLVTPPFFGPEYLQAFRMLRFARAARLARLLRVAGVAGIALESAKDALQHRKIHYVAAFTIFVVSLGAMGIYVVEHGRNPNITSLGDAFWWSIVTATTVGYGDVSPVTGEGRVIAVTLMLVGIGFISILTATVASFFVDQGNNNGDEIRQLQERLARMEQKQDELLERLKERAF
jgi:voltage-gated potassium channel